MKVLHVIPSLWRGDGGPSHAIRAMERALAAQGVDVTTATTDDDGPGRRNGRPCGVPLAEEGAQRWYFAKRMDFYKPAPAFAAWVKDSVRDYDLVHVHGLFSFTSTSAARAARRAKVPFVLRPLGSLARWGVAHRRPALKRLSLRWIEGPMLRHAAAVHFTSEDEAREARELAIPFREAIVPLGVDTPALAEAKARPTERLLFLSRLAPKKNLEGLLDALALLVPEFPRLQLDIAGDGDPAYVQALRARAQSAGLAGHVRWLGRVEGEAKARAFAEADVFVLPSFSENFGIAAAEALAAALPCVLGEGVAIAKEVALAGAGLAVGTSAHDIAQGLRLIIPQPRRAAMALIAHRLAAERYSVDAMGRNLHRLYTDILNGAHGLPGSR